MYQCGIFTLDYETVSPYLNALRNYNINYGDYFKGVMLLYISSKIFVLYKCYIYIRNFWSLIPALKYSYQFSKYSTQFFYYKKSCKAKYFANNTLIILSKQMKENLASH